ncbi:translation machinery-associated protein 20 [Fusarium falciforme]|nr:translation machinery-associated protein 20 [Fusarium falciforme]
MFKKEIQSSPKQKLKSSVQRSLRQALLSTYPLLTPHIDEILPKKASLASMKLTDRNTLYVLDSTPLFYQQDISSTIIPHLRLVHRFPRRVPEHSHRSWCYSLRALGCYTYGSWFDLSWG